MIRELVDFVVPARWEQPARRAAEHSIDHVESVVHDWINSYRPHHGAHPLLLSCALNTAELIEIVAFGGYAGSYPSDCVEVEPAVAVKQRERRFRFLSESSFRRDVTMNVVGGLRVLARIPDDVVPRHAEGRRVLSEMIAGGQVLGLTITRGHLSEGSPTDAPRDLAFADASRVGCEMTSGFEFRCELLVVEDEHGRRPWRPDESINERRFWDPRSYCPVVYVPGRWITDAIVDDDGPLGWKRLPLPTWTT